MTSSLEELKTKLYKAFDDAISRADNYSNAEAVRAGNLRAAADLAKSIVTVETRIDERNADKNGMKLPGKG